MREIWKPVLSYGGSYSVSNLGRVRSNERDVIYKRFRRGSYEDVIQHVPERILKQGIHNAGYMTASMSKNGQTKNELVHVLVATAFLPNPNDFPHINHIDANKKNNRVDNLEWVSYQQNVIHAVNHGLNPQAIPVICVQTNKSYPSMGSADRDMSFPIGSVSGYFQTGKPIHGYTFRKL